MPSNIPSYHESRQSGSDHCIVVFSSFALKDYGPDAFSFRHFFEPHAADVDLLFVKDRDNQWYNRGLGGLGQDPPEVAASLRKRLSGYRQLTMFGSSMGGYASLLYGSAIGATRIISASPQTFLAAPFPRYHAKRHRGAFIDLRSCQFEATKDVDIFIGEECLFDIYQCVPFAALPNLRLHFVPDTFHVPVDLWKQDGILDRLTRSLCAPDSDGAYVRHLGASFADSRIGALLRTTGAPNLISEAVESFYHERYRQAVAALQALLTLEPSWLGARSLLGQAMLRAGMEDDALAQFDFVHAANVCIDDFHADYASLLARRGHADAALAVARQAVRLNRSHAPLLASVKAMGQAGGERGGAEQVVAPTPTPPPATSTPGRGS